MQNWTLGTPAFTSTLGELSRKVQTPWLLYVPFFCGDADGGNVYEKEGFRFVQVGNAQHKTLSFSVGFKTRTRTAIGRVDRQSFVPLLHRVSRIRPSSLSRIR